MLEALCRQSSTTLDIVHAEDGPPITQRTSGLDLRAHALPRANSTGWGVKLANLSQMLCESK